MAIEYYCQTVQAHVVLMLVCWQIGLLGGVHHHVFEKLHDLYVGEAVHWLAQQVNEPRSCGFV